MEKQTIGVQLIATERQKQIDKHGFTAEHHVNHPEWYTEKQLIQMAACLLLEDLTPHDLVTEIPANWDAVWFQDLMDRGPRERLIIAGALLAAELDRLDAICLLECTGCDSEFDMTTMTPDSDSNYFCPECWKELSPGMRKDYEDMKAKGEID